MEQANYRRNITYVQYLLHYMQQAGGNMYTIEDILALPEGERAELIDGEMFMMATPTTAHQESLMWLSVTLFSYVQQQNGKCRVIPAPFGVFIKKDDKNYLEPDISVICNRDKLDNKGCQGAPDWVVEIVSPSSRDMDCRRKLKVYKEAGVREYWIVDLQKETVTVYDFDNCDEATVYYFTDTVKSQVIKGLYIDFSELKKYLYE